MADSTVNLKVKTTGAEKAESSFRNLGKSMVGFATKASVASVAIIAISKGIFNIAKDAGRIEGVANAFARMGGNISKLRKATAGTVDDFTLMSTAVKASQLGVTGLADKLAFAKLRARETGEEVGVLTQQLILGIGRQSVMRLDDLGISLVRVREEIKNTGSFADALNKIIAEDLGSEKNKKALSALADEAESIGTGFTNAWDSAKGFIGVIAGKVSDDTGLGAWIKKQLGGLKMMFDLQSGLGGKPSDPQDNEAEVVDQRANAYAKWVLELELANEKKAQELAFMQQYIAESIGVVEQIHAQAEGYDMMTAKIENLEGPIKKVAALPEKMVIEMETNFQKVEPLANNLISTFDYIFTEVLIRENDFLTAMLAGFKGMLASMAAEMAAKAAVFGIFSMFGAAPVGTLLNYATGGMFSHDGGGMSPSRSGGGNTTNINMPNVAMINSRSIGQINQALSRHRRLH